MTCRSAILLTLLAAIASPLPADAQWRLQASGTSSELRALVAVNGRVAWAAGKGGVFTRTVDGGASWRADTVPGATGLFFIGVAAVDADTAWLAGTSFADSIPDGRLYRTVDGGRTWQLQWRSTRAGMFLDGVRCWDARHAVAFGDALDGRMVVLTTADGGASWSAPALLPPALPGEAGFAASGTALALRGTGAGARAWVGTGGGARARVYRTEDRGRSWAVAATPLPAGRTAGIFGVAFRDDRHGLAVGGEYTHPRASGGSNVLGSSDGGRTWRMLGEARPAGVRYGVAWVPGAATPTAVAVGPSGSGYTVNGGRSWMEVDSVAYNTVAFAAPDAGWAAGPDGRIARWTGSFRGRSSR